MSYLLNTYFTNPKTIVCENDVKSLARFLSKKFNVKKVNIDIKEVDMHKRVEQSLSHESLQVFNQIKINAVDYLGKFSLQNVCTSRGDNHIRDVKGKVYYVAESAVEVNNGTAFMSLSVVSSHNVVGFFESALNGVFKNPQRALPTHMVRTIRQSLVFAKKEDRGELDGDIVDMKEEVPV